MKQTIEERIRAALREYTVEETAYWYPLCTLKKELPVAAYDLDRIYHANDIGQIWDTLNEAGIRDVQLYQMQTNGRRGESVDFIDLLYEKDEDGYCFPWLVETYFFDASAEWLIYVSHEGTITFSGARLVSIAGKLIDPQYFLGGFRR